MPHMRRVHFNTALLEVRQQSLLLCLVCGQQYARVGCVPPSADWRVRCIAGCTSWTVRGRLKTLIQRSIWSVDSILGLQNMRPGGPICRQLLSQPPWD